MSIMEIRKMLLKHYTEYWMVTSLAFSKIVRKIAIYVNILKVQCNSYLVQIEWYFGTKKVQYYALRNINRPVKEVLSVY